MSPRAVQDPLPVDNNKCDNKALYLFRRSQKPHVLFERERTGNNNSGRSIL